MNGGRQLLDLVFAVDLGSRSFLLKELFLFVVINVRDSNGVELTSLPVGFGGFVSENVFVCLHLVIVMFQVTASHQVVVSLRVLLDCFAAFSLDSKRKNKQLLAIMGDLHPTR